MVGLVVWRIADKLLQQRAQQQQREVRLKAPPVISVAVSKSRVIIHTFETTGTAEGPLSVSIAFAQAATEHAIGSYKS